MAKPTIRDVAQRAGVSVSVASNALNDKGRVSDATRQRVKEAALAMGYVGDYAARRLRGVGGAIGVVITDTLEAIPLERYTGESLYWFYRLADEAGYKLHQFHLPSTEYDESRLYSVLNDGAIDGAIFVVPRLSQIETITRVMERLNHLPHLFFGAIPDLPDVNYVDGDGRKGASEAIAHLLARGHEHIAYLMPSDGHDHFDARDRLLGARSEMAAAGLELAVYYAEHWESNISLDAILANETTAIITWNDLFALRIIGELDRRGIDVPGDIAVVGFDDEAFSKWMRPALTTISQPIEAMSRTAVDFLVERIKNGATESCKKIFPMDLIVRESG
jgi:DNA-binding LacI/PurR family transcriptional regulator